MFFWFNPEAYRLRRALGAAVMVVPLMVLAYQHKARVTGRSEVMSTVSAVEIQRQGEITYYHAYLELPDYPVLEIVVKTPYELKQGDQVPVVCETYKKSSRHCKYEREVFEDYYAKQQ